MIYIVHADPMLPHSPNQPYSSYNMWSHRIFLQKDQLEIIKKELNEKISNLENENADLKRKIEILDFDLSQSEDKNDSNKM